MKTLTKTIKAKKVETWLPVFSGFYETMWNGDDEESREIEYINELRKDKGLQPIEWDDVDFNFDQYQKDVVNGVTNYIGKELIKLGLIETCKLQKLSSPREYNFANDSIHVVMTLTEANMQKIESYLNSHKEQFEAYLKDRYTSYSGFISFHSNNVNEWLEDVQEALLDDHKLGSILEFILRDEDGSEGNELEWSIYEKLTSNGLSLEAKNYTKLTGGK